MDPKKKEGKKGNIDEPRIKLKLTLHFPSFGDPPPPLTHGNIEIQCFIASRD